MSLTAVILVGGEGTRLRPLTARTPKPMLPLVDRPLLAYTFDHLRRHGVDRAVLACGYRPTQIRRHFGEDADGIALEYRVEPEPLGTAGAIRFGAGGLEERFLAVNGDSLRGADLGRLLEFHRERGAAATILLTPVPDPARYGLVRVYDDGRVQSFLEKPRPEEIDTDLINAGVYVLEPRALDLIATGRPVSIEREIFPLLVEAGSLYALALPGYWLDVGTPESYLQAHRDVLGKRSPPVHVDASATVASSALVSLASVGAEARVGEGTVLEDSIVGPRATVGRDCRVIRSIVAEEAVIEDRCELVDLAVVGPGARVGEGNRLGAGVRVDADTVIPPPTLTST